MAVTTIGNGVLKRAGQFLHVLPKPYWVAGTLGICLFLFYLDSLTGPWIPFGIFYLLNLYVSVKYVGSRYAYLMAFVSAAGKTYIKIQHYPEATYWWQGHWQFISSYSIYTLFCYLMNAQLSGRRRAEEALDKVSQLNEAIIAKTDSGVLVFDDAGQCVVANAAAAKILGSSLEQLRRYNFKKDESWRAPILLEAGLKTIRTGVTQKFTSPLCTVLGKDVWCVGSVGKINRTDGSYLLMMFADISAYKEAEDAKKQADKLAAMALNRAGVAERKLLSISEETQQRIGRELHDDLGQHMTGIAFMSEVLFQKLKAMGLEEMQDASKVTAMVNEAVSRTRQLAQGLYPAELKENGLRAMLEKFAGHIEAMYHINCDFICTCACQIDDPEVAINLFRITQEAVNNAVRHGHATHIAIKVSNSSSSWGVEILDDGCGIGDMSSSKEGGLGMRTMRYRADLIGASLEVHSMPAGGTRVAISLPVQ